LGSLYQDFSLLGLKSAFGISAKIPYRPKGSLHKARS
jgi:hypothetical protein